MAIESKNLELYKKAQSLGLKQISFSQLSMFLSCPLQYKYQYIENRKTPFQESIHLIFGTALHTAFQEFLQLYYNKTINEAIRHDTNKVLLSTLKECYSNRKNKEEHYTTPEQLQQFYLQGTKILDYVKKNVSEIFPKRNHKLIGVEYPIFHQLNDKIVFIGLADIVIKNEIDNSLLIPDIKTSGRGWSESDKKDWIKLLQLRLYKKFLSIQFNIPIEKIYSEYLVCKREMNGNDYEKQIQRVPVPSGKIIDKKVDKSLEDFLYLFDENGIAKTDYEFSKATYPITCKWCQYQKDGICNGI